MFFGADIGDSFQGFLDTLFEWLPRLIGALVILLVAWIVARVIAALLRRVLPRTGMDRAVHSGQVGSYVNKYAAGFRPSDVIATIGFWFVFLTGIVLALSTLGIQSLNNAIEAIVGYLPNVVAAILILAVALAIAAGVGGVVAKVMGDTALGRVTAAVVPVLVLTVAAFMALVQLQIAVPIVTGAFYIVLGAIGLGAALAFGLGGTKAAERIVAGAYEKGREHAPQMREEYRVAKERGKDIAEEARQGDARLAQP